MKKIRESKQFYKGVCVDSERGDPINMRRLLNCKKLFSFPWLLCPEVLINEYPDKYDSPEFRLFAAKTQAAREKKRRAKLSEKENFHLLPKDPREPRVQKPKKAGDLKAMPRDEKLKMMLGVETQAKGQFMSKFLATMEQLEKL
mmetsp:Transcript_29111/g.43873  ORF Transcript_29111/g.43873 Transcript_29111/m.43873 type:complete len:144 (-) Transcript_29111:38-469(-)